MLFDWGSGKVAQPARAVAGPVLVLAHRDELLDQTRDKISRAVGLAAEKARKRFAGMIEKLSEAA